MKPQHTERLKKTLPRVATAVVAVIAFGLGTSAGGGDEETADGHDHAAEGEAEDGTVWTCSMHPQIRASEPGQCPICGMDLIPATSGEDTPAPNEITLSERAKTLARIRTTRVERHGRVGAERRLLGRVAYDETNLATVTAWIGGRIDNLRVEATGERVRRGQPIATLYSPEVYAAHQDLLQAKRQIDRLSQGSETARSAAQAAYRAARQRLALLGVPEAELERMERADSPWRQIAIRSPFSGTVTERLASEGQYVQTGTPLYRIADLSELWVQLDAYESDLPLLRVGQTVHLDVRALPGEDLTGEVSFIDPVVDPRTRTARVRVAIDNPDGRLRPGMFAEAHVQDAEIEETEGEMPPLVIPDSAPLFTGRRSVVYVEKPNAEAPTYEARVVRLGPRMGDLYPVVAGLLEGERVVTHGAFTLDADLQIRGGISMMALPDDTEEGPYDDLIQVPPAFTEGLQRVLRPYLDVQEALADDELEPAKQAAQRMLAAAEGFEPEGPAAAVRHWEHLGEDLQQRAGHVATASSIEEARRGFMALTEPVLKLIHLFGNPMDVQVRVAWCPMADDNNGASWLQRGDVVDNPYFGSSMLTCGEVQHEIDAKSYLPELTRAEPSAAAPGGHQH